MAITYEYHYGNGGFILSTPQQKELEKLLIEQVALASSGAKSLAVPLYDKILSYLPVPSINVGEYFKVYTWLQGAREVNNDSSVYSVFIRNYTKIQYELRYGELNELELSILNNKIDEASNNIGFELVRNILNHNGLLPGLEGLGVLDGGEAARKVFQGDIYPEGDFTGWAGTMLFPFLGYDRFYEEWLLTTEEINAEIRTGSGIVDRIIKEHSGTYDLIAALQANQETIDSYNLLESIYAVIRSFENADKSQQEIIEQTNSFISTTYALPADHPFLAGNKLPYDKVLFQTTNLGFSSGSQGDDNYKDFWIGDRANYLNYIVHAGMGNDGILGVPTTYPSLIPGSALIDGGPGFDSLSYHINKDANDNGTPLKLSITFEEIASHFYNWRFSIDKSPSEGYSIYKGHDYAYSIEFLEGTNNSDTFIIKTLPTFNEIITVDLLGSKTGYGDTIDLSNINHGVDALISDGITSIPFSENGSITIMGVENIIGTSFNDILHGDNVNNIIVGGRGDNTIYGNGGEDKFVITQGVNTIKDADSNDKLYINLSAVNPLTNQKDLGLELKGGFIIRSSSPNPGGSATLQDGDTAIFYPAIPNPMNFSPALGGSGNMIDETLGDQFIVRYTLSGTTLFVSASFADLEPAEAIIENYDTGDLGLKFKSLVVPNYSNAAASHAGNMDQLVDQYVQLHSEMITDRFTLPTSSDLWYA
ncbi:calcium-binding protein [Pectobacterium brasiliense]|uniref:calcium-binding protein n=1 Tax=Pectobacterium brasiliense TaxID=180957 RepID=UPI0015DD6590|nr:calcium-binding protein [Pectobacterium brasiliense]MBA0194976.1 calcium-binding protein [Pectobacterium brasiliense]MBN3092807.1 calcium-binding protein [Pectobacterium brasiliense]MBN3141545.1 calcium-binding protein [Pectobacterium brasiliense]MBW5897025.1 calcium-binding protein [Pectobacterium brasiliense]